MKTIVVILISLTAFAGGGGSGGTGFDITNRVSRIDLAKWKPGLSIGKEPRYDNSSIYKNSQLKTASRVINNPDEVTIEYFNAKRNEVANYILKEMKRGATYKEAVEAASAYIDFNDSLVFTKDDFLK